MIERKRTRSRASGAAVLTVGVLSVVGLELLGPVAWWMGNESLKSIEKGDSEGTDKGMVNAGRVCGMVGTALLCLALL